MNGKRKSHIITGIVFIAVCIVVGVFLAVSTTPREPSALENKIAAYDAKADAIDAAANVADDAADLQSNTLAAELDNQLPGNSVDNLADPFNFYRDGKLLPGTVILDKDVFGTLRGNVDIEVLGRKIDSQDGIIRLAIEADIPQSDYRGMLLHRCGSVSDYRWMTFSPPLGDDVSGKQADAAAADVVDKKVIRNIFQSFCLGQQVDPATDQPSDNSVAG